MTDDFIIRDRPGAPIGQVRKTALERRQYTFDYSNWLDVGETVLGFEVHVVPQQAFDDPSTLVTSSIAVTVDGSIASVYAEDGSEGALYALQLIAKTSINRIKEDGVLIDVVSDVDGTFGGSCDCNGAVPPLGALPVAPPDSLGSYAEQLAVLGPNTLSPLKYQPWDVNSTMEIVVNGRAFAACVRRRGRSPCWRQAGHLDVHPSFGFAPGDEVVARYRYVTEPMTTSQIVAATLYYVGVAGQTNFSLSVPDRYGATWTLSPGQPVNVTRNGSRLVPDLGAGDGGYKITANVIMLLWPAGKGETVIIDVFVAVGAPSFCLLRRRSSSTTTRS